VKTIYFSLTFGVLTLSVYLMVVGRQILLPFVVAVLIWYLFNSFAGALNRVPMVGRNLPWGICLAVSILFVLMMLWGLVELIAANLQKVASVAPTYQANLEIFMGKIAGFLELKKYTSVDQLVSQINIAGSIKTLATSITGIAANTGTIVLYVVFLLIEQNSFDRKISALAPDAAREKTLRKTLDHIGVQIQSYIWVKTIMSILTGVVSYAILAWIGVDFAGFWAVLIFLLNYIPYIGSLLGVLFPTLLTLLQFESWSPFLIVAVGLAAVQICIGNILEPRIMGRSLNLSPIVLLLSLTIWGSVWGVAGMFLSVPIMVTLMIVLSHFPQTRSVAILMSQDGRID